MKGLVWFRRDLRLQDNAALAEALSSGLPVEAIYIHEAESDISVSAGSASRWYLHHSLLALQKDLAGIGVSLQMVAGSSQTMLPAFCGESSVSKVYWNRVVEPVQEAIDQEVGVALKGLGVSFQVFPDDCLIMPEHAYKKDGSVYRVFSPFWKNLQQCLERELLEHRLVPKPREHQQPVPYSTGVVDVLQLLSQHPWHHKLHRYWQPGEASAHRLLEAFLDAKYKHYEAHRDLPAIDGTSRLSPALHFGEISAVRVYARCRDAWEYEPDADSRAGIVRFLSELGWREFARHVLHAFPRTAAKSQNARFDQEAAWEPDPDGRLLKAWQRGETGITLVDAGMRELWETGWMHSRVRMIVGSFLTKNLGIHWREGARWFRETLVDADLASNTLGWQWIAGCGTDAAPYFRIFNPDTQARKFDPEGQYISRWLGHGLRPVPVVDLKATRLRALERNRRIMQQSKA